MNKIELVTGLPNWRWKEHSRQEILLTGEELVHITDFVWQIGNVAVAGFMHTSYTAPPWMWFVLAENVGIRDLVDFRRLAERIPKGTLTAVDVNFPLALKFAKLYGFTETDEVLDYLDKTYQVLRKN